MEIDSRFPTKLGAVSDAPEPLRSALVVSLASGEPEHLLVHAPAFPTGDEKSPATILAVTNTGWLVASESENGAATVEKSDYNNTLFLELTSILLLSQLEISFAAADGMHRVKIRFESVWDEFYREAIDLILAGIDPARTAVAEKGRNETSMFEAWPMKFRNEARRYWPRGQRLLAAVQWPTVFDDLERELAPAGALLITERELVLISEGKKSSAELAAEVPSIEESKERPTDQEIQPARESPGGITPAESSVEAPLAPVVDNAEINPDKLPADVYEFAEIVTFVPRVRLADFHVSRQERFGLLVLELNAANGRETLDIIFPSDDEKIVSNAMDQVSLSQGSANQITHGKIPL